MSTLVVSSYMPVLGSGRATRTYGIVRALAASGPVDLLHLGFGAERPDPAYERIDGVRLHGVGGSRGPRRALAYARARAAGVPRPVARGVSPDLARAADRLAADRVVAEDAMAAVALRSLGRPVIYSANNLESAFRRDWGPPERVRAFERHLLEDAAEAWLPSLADLEGARDLAPDAELRYVPNVVDVAAIEPRRAPVDPPEALLVGDFSYAPNREGLGFLLGEVMPRAWERAPKLRLSVAGRGAGEAPDGRVTVHGFVDDLDPLYERAACALVPLLTGGGSPLKFVEALARGIPVVATPRAAAGVEADAGRHFLEGDGAAGFADALIAAIDAQELGAAGRALAEREYSIEALARLLAP